jgi:hypothetical protein
MLEPRKSVLSLSEIGLPSLHQELLFSKIHGLPGDGGRVGARKPQGQSEQSDSDRSESRYERADVIKNVAEKEKGGDHDVIPLALLIAIAASAFAYLCCQAKELRGQREHSQNNKRDQDGP